MKCQTCGKPGLLEGELCECGDGYTAGVGWISDDPKLDMNNSGLSGESKTSGCGAVLLLSILLFVMWLATSA